LQKYTVQSTGIWERVRRLLAVDPDRSNGVPLNRQFRNPPPGALDPTTYDDPVTLPAADIADNPYWKRDMRRAYPALSVVSQADEVALLTYGSAAEPKEGKLGLGEAGRKQLVEVKEMGLAELFEREKGAVGAVLGVDGLPPKPTGLGRDGVKKYVMDADREEGFPPE
jgi:hypothetical protein